MACEMLDSAYIIRGADTNALYVHSKIRKELVVDITTHYQFSLFVVIQSLSKKSPTQPHLRHGIIRRLIHT